MLILPLTVARPGLGRKGFTLSWVMGFMRFTTGVGWIEVLGRFGLLRFLSLLDYMCYEWLLHPTFDDLTRRVTQVRWRLQKGRSHSVERFSRREVQHLFHSIPR